MEVIVGVIILGLIAFGVIDWRKAVIAALFLVVWEGALRKWAVPELHQWVYFAKDFLLLGAYIRFFAERLFRGERVFFRHPANPVLVLLTLLSLEQLLNPALPNFAIGLFGIKAYLYYMPLMYMTPALFPNYAGLRRIIIVFVLAASIPLSLGPIQFANPGDSFLNKYAWEDEAAPGVATMGESGGRIRVTGTFSYISGYAVYLLLLALLEIALLMDEKNAKLRLALYSLVGLTFANLLMTGSRGPFIILITAIPAMLLLAAGAKRPGRIKYALTICLVLPAVVGVAGRVFPEAQGVFLDRAEQAEDTESRFISLVTGPLWALGEAGVLGYGIGTTHQAMAPLFPYRETTPPAAEGEWERIILEVGPIGLLLTLLVRFFVVKRLWDAVMAARGTEFLPLLSVALVFILVHIPGNLVFNHTASFFYWFLAGIALIPRASRTWEPIRVSDLKYVGDHVEVGRLR